MCILKQINVYHFCLHTERVTVPSINPFCKKNVDGHGYVMNEWCPRCRWWGVTPYKYTEFAEAVHCGGYSGKVIRTVNFDQEEFKITHTNKEKWAARLHMIVETIPRFRRDQYTNVWLRERPVMQAGFNEFERSYFMEDLLAGAPERNRSPELFHNIDIVPADRDQCEVCKGRLTKPHEGEEEENGDTCVSGYGQAVYLPCDHYFGLNCITPWMGNPDIRTPTCPTCRQKYIIVHEHSPEDYVVAPPGFEEQRKFTFAPKKEIEAAKRAIWFMWFLKIGLVALCFSALPSFTWTTVIMTVIGSYIFQRWFIVLVQPEPEFALREKIMANRFALFSSFVNTAEILLTNRYGYSPYLLQYQLLPSWLYPWWSWGVYACFLAYCRPNLRLPAEIRGRSGIQVLL
ncbi:hypothetical protein VTL71DRAFT_3387 [Oculimacula yallundae]|uniref:RING-type domain-containing protein n=1 Tax=Oculimacula yallundae TaxID=86028 RepID=A0ABR4C871_9HELO